MEVLAAAVEMVEAVVGDADVGDVADEALLCSMGS